MTTLACTRNAPIGGGVGGAPPMGDRVSRPSFGVCRVPYKRSRRIVFRWPRPKRLNKITEIACSLGNAEIRLNGGFRHFGKVAKGSEKP